MPFDNLFAFGRAGNGDLWCLAYNSDNSLKDNIFGWNHENDSRIWVAISIKDLAARLSSEMIIDTMG